VAELLSAVHGLRSDTTILLAPGRFVLPEVLAIGSARDVLTNVSLRGATGNRGDVVIAGHGLATGKVQGLQVADLTFANVIGPALQIRGERGAARPHIYNVGFVDVAGSAVEASASPDRSDGGVDRGLVEYSVFEALDVGPMHDAASAVVIDGGRQWVVRYNQFRNLRAGTEARVRLRPAILARLGSQGTAVHNNLFVDCEQALAYGESQPGGPVDHVGGIIYNNFIYRRRGFSGGDAGIMLWGSPGTKVYHNTVILNGTYHRPIEYRFPITEGVDIRNNLTDGPIESREGGQAFVAGNFTKATADMFRDARAGDLRLVGTAEQAIHHGVQIAEPLPDWERTPRPVGSRPDIGAHEFRGS
jgi:hypothetical protein